MPNSHSGPIVALLLCAWAGATGCGSGDSTGPVAPSAPAEQPGPDEKFEVDLWSWGARAAVSLTVDDGLRAPLERLLPEVERRGWRATLFVCTEMATEAGTWPAIEQAYRRGHEIGSHTHTHRDLTGLDAAGVRDELERAIHELQSRLGWEIPLESFAYPYESTNDGLREVIWDYHRFARGGDQGVEVPPHPVPLNDAYRPDWTFLTAKAPTTGYDVAAWNGWVDEAVRQGKWLIEEYHGIDGEDWEPRSSDEYRAHFDHLEAYGDEVWVAPLGDVGHYIDERQTARFEVDGWSAREIRFRLVDNFGPRHDVPLSYTVRIPDDWGWAGIRVVQDEQVRNHERIEPGLFRSEGLPDPERPIRITPAI